MAMPYDALYRAERDGETEPLPFPDAVDAACRTLAERQQTNINDDRAMFDAACRLEEALRQLLTSLATETGRSAVLGGGEGR